MKRFNYFILLFWSITNLVTAQQNYNDFDSIKFQYFGYRNGTLDSVADNPGINSINASARCAKYKRVDTILFDNIKMYPFYNLKNVSQYATYLGSPPKIRLKLFTTAPPGTMIEAQLGNKGDDLYPSGIHSKYQAITTIQNAWAEIFFSFSEKPQGGLVDSTIIDKVVLLFSPNSLNGDIYYIDDFTGPDLAFPENTWKETLMNDNFELSQNYPNPVCENTVIHYKLRSEAFVSLKVFDILGNEVLKLIDQEQAPGDYNILASSRNLKNGVYFYTLSVNGNSQTNKRMLVLNL